MFAAHCWDSVHKQQHITYVVMTATPFGHKILMRGGHGRRRWQKRNKNSKQLQRPNGLFDLRLLSVSRFHFIELPRMIYNYISLLH